MKLNHLCSRCSKLVLGRRCTYIATTNQKKYISYYIFILRKQNLCRYCGRRRFFKKYKKNRVPHYITGFNKRESQSFSSHVLVSTKTRETYVRQLTGHFRPPRSGASRVEAADTAPENRPIRSHRASGINHSQNGSFLTANNIR